MQSQASPSGTSLPRQLRLAAIAILAIGWIAAVLVYCFAENGERMDGDSAEYQLVRGQVVAVPFSASKREQQELARLGGDASVRIVEFDSWLGTLWHGERLAYTLAVMATVVGAACLYVAGLAAEDVGD